MTGTTVAREATGTRLRAAPVAPIAVTHVITSLAAGGAEMMLSRLLRAMDRERFANSVISLRGGGAAAERIRAAGFPVKLLDLRKGGGGLPDLGHLARELRRQRPDLLQTWMYHADLLGGLASLTVPGLPVLWNLRCGRLDRAIDKRSTIWISRVCAAASRILPVRIISCSEAACEAHAAAGYARARMQVIPNGFDTDEFRPDAACRRALREELGVAPDALLIGMIARFHGAKDHTTFFEAASRFHLRRPGVHFVLCGENVTGENVEIASGVSRAGIVASCHLLGRRDDVPRIMAALDVAVSSSFIEGFPNAVGEAMACGVPCVATDAGESRRLMGGSGLIVPVRDPEALAAGMLQLVELGAARRAAVGTTARRRIVERFGIAAAARSYEQVYEKLASRCVG